MANAQERGTHPSAHSAEFDHHALLDELETRIARVDRYLKYGVKTLLTVARIVMRSPVTESADPLTIPPWISETATASPEHYPLCHAQVAATLQKVWRRRRRFPYLKTEETDFRDIIEWLPKPFPSSLAGSRRTLEFVKSLDSRAFGALNPLTASQVFRALLQQGEEATISPRGILSLFAVLWALGRRHDDSGAVGAALEPWKPTATVTAKCVFAITALVRTSRNRANLFSEMRKALDTLKTHKAAARRVDRWRFCMAADRLAGFIYEFAEISSRRQELRGAADDVLKRAAALNSASSSKAYASAHTAIRKVVGREFKEWRKGFQSCVRSVDPLLHTLIPRIERSLSGSRYPKTLWKFGCKQFRLDGDAKYWDDQANAAGRARRLCSKMLTSLGSAAKMNAAGSLAVFLARMARSYERTAKDLEEALRPCIRWCQVIVRDQIAHASAGNDTEFDAAELVSATAVCGLWPSFSQLETRAAIQKSRAGCRPDGSWSRGQPIYLLDRALGAWPSTPDIVWMLCTALDNYPETTEVDDLLMRFVDWSERTLNLVKPRDSEAELRGWSSELYRDERTIDLWTTAVTVNALLEIRDILERRALQLCEKRFSVERVLPSLDDVLPVDLGAAHGAQLHRRLLDVVRVSRDADGGGEYSFVLHGPPGSSKTLLANALAAEMWQPHPADEVRLIRITPADFTRKGSERLEDEARFIFRLLSRTRRVTILFDEIDDLLRERLTSREPTFFKLVVPAMLNRLQDLRDAAPRQEICFVLGTNFIDRIDPALIRPGRMDAVIPVVYPDAFSRVAIFEEPSEENPPSRVGRNLFEAIEQAEGLPYVVVKRIAALPRQDLKALVRPEDKEYDVEQHYRDRGGLKSAALVNECLHAIASRRSDQMKNEKCIDYALAKMLTVGKDKLVEELRAICKKEGRLTPLSRRRSP